MKLNQTSSIIQTPSYLHWFQHPEPIQFNIYQTSCNPKLFELIRTRLKSEFKITKRHTQPLQSILYHLQVSARTNIPIELSITDDRPLKNILGSLKKLKVVDFKKGHSDIGKGYTYLSKFQPTDGIRQMICKLPFLLKDIEQVRVINIKDEKGNVTERIQLDDSTIDGQCIKLFNGFIKTHQIQCDILPGDFDKNHHLYGFTGNIFLNSQVVRIYTDKEGVGGRLYNQDAFQVQSLSKSIRKRITIDGEPTVELDFKAFHPSMIYNLEGLETPMDAYSIFSDDPSGLLKKCTKRAFNIFINSANIPEAVKGLTYELFCEQGALGAVLKQHYQSKPQSCVAKLLRAVYTAHNPVKKWFCQAGWETLQNKDSDMMLLILMNLKEKGIPALPIHDSIIVPEKDAHAAHRVMRVVYKKTMGFDIQIEGLPMAA